MQRGGFLRRFVMILNAVKTVGRGNTHAGHMQHSSVMRWLLRDDTLQVDALAVLFAVTMSLQPTPCLIDLRRSVHGRRSRGKQGTSPPEFGIGGTLRQIAPPSDLVI